jgi:4-hydroxy-tetrahydrodipicolinate synthase
MKWPDIITALITPYDDEGRVNVQKAAELAQSLWGQGSGGFVVAGSTGEAFALSLEEREALFRAVRQTLPPEVPVWVGTGSNDSRETWKLTEAADAWGADGMLIVSPYYNKPPHEGLVEHFVEAARRTTKPVMIYDVPGRTGVQVRPETVLAVKRRAENVAAVKEAAGTITALIAMHRVLPDDVRLYSGDDALFLPSLAVGASGVVSVASHVAAPLMARLALAWQAGDHHAAVHWHEIFWPLANQLFCESNPIPLKWLMNRMGWDVGGLRPPLTMLPDERFQGLWTAYQEALAAQEARPA